MSDLEWYFARGDKKQGPMSSAQLVALAAQGLLLPTDLVWKQGMTEWVPASTVNGLHFASQSPRSRGETQATLSNLSSPAFFDRVLNTAREWLPLSTLESFSSRLTDWGALGIAVLMIICPLLALILAVKTNRLTDVLFSVGIFCLLAVSGFTSQKLIHATAVLIKSTQSTMASTAFLDCCALVNILIGLVALACSIYATLYFNMYIYAVVGVGCFAFFEYTAWLSLHPKCLGITIESSSSAGQEALGILSYFFKLLVRFIPVGFFAGIAMSILGFVWAGINMLGLYGGGGSEAALIQGATIAIITSGILICSVSLPFLGYFIFVFGCIQLDLMKALLNISNKIDKMSDIAARITTTK